MNVVYTFDDGYSTISCVSILSLLKTNQAVEYLNLYIVDCGISEKSKQILIELSASFNRKITFIDGKNMEDRIPVKLDLGYWSFVCYVRLFFPELLNGIDKVMHIDCDTLIMGDLEEVYDFDISNDLCAGCYDCLPTPKYMANLEHSAGYYSNGFLIFNLDMMRKENIQQRFIDYIVSKNGILPHLDQDVLNAVLCGKIRTLPPQYNVMTYTLLFGKSSRNFFTSNDMYYSEIEINEALKNPIVIHLVGYRYTSRPWSQPCFHPCNKLWKSYYKDVIQNFGGDNTLLKYKRKKYGIFRDIICLFWNLGHKFIFIRKIQFKTEQARIRKKCAYYCKTKANDS